MSQVSLAARGQAAAKAISAKKNARGSLWVKTGFAIYVLF
jgi:hypothetical protein